jgi:hypothetical protein
VVDGVRERDTAGVLEFDHVEIGIESYDPEVTVGVQDRLTDHEADGGRDIIQSFLLAIGHPRGCGPATALRGALCHDRRRFTWKPQRRHKIG